MLRYRVTSTRTTVLPSGEESSCVKEPPKKPNVVKTQKNGFGLVGLLLHHMTRTLLWAVVVVYVVVPLWFRTCPFIRRHMIYMNYVNLSPVKNLTHPGSLGFPCSRNLYFEVDSNVSLGVWHLAPTSLADGCGADVLLPDAEFKDNRTVILYLHGSGGTRGARHRLSMYKVLVEEKVDAHVITFDYRGFADSSEAAVSSKSLVRDAAAVYSWLRQRTDPSRLFVWGHSMGTGVAVLMTTTLPSDQQPTGIVLEAPFTSIADAAAVHPLTTIYRHMPFFRYFFVEPTRYHETNLDSDEKIANVSDSSVLILHAKDDELVSFNLGKQLYDRAVRERRASAPPAEFIEYEEHFGYGHKNIHRDPELPQRIAAFFQTSKLHALSKR